MQNTPGKSEYNLATIATIASIIGVLLVFLYIYGVFLLRYDYPVEFDVFSPSTPLFIAAAAIVNQILERGVPDIESRALRMAALTFGIALTMILTVAWFIWNKWKKTRMLKFMKKRYSSLHGTAEMGTVGDLKKLTGDDGVLIGQGGRKKVRLSLRASCEHTAIIGPTGCGKTSRFFIPNLLSLPEGSSAIVTDPKGEMAKITGPYLRSKGWDVYTFHPHEPYNFGLSCIYNPLQLAKSDTEVSELAEIMIRNGYFSAGQAGDTQWISFSQPLWEAALLAIRHREDVPCISDAYDIIATMTEEDRSEEFKNIGGMAMDRYLAYLQSAQSPETSASIRTVLLSSIKNFVRPDIAAVTNGEATFRVSTLRKKPSVFFIQVPERKAHLMKPLTATMYWQIIEHIMDEDGCPIFFFLDEFPNIGQIPGFSQLAATARSRGISLNIGIQGVEQLAREYSKEEQVDILNNMKTKIYFPGSTGEAGSQVANLGGYSTINQDGAHHRKELLTADELRRIPDDSVLVLAHNLSPVILQSVPYFATHKNLFKR
jgi:type IV secretion system protein VirD4